MKKIGKERPKVDEKEGDIKIVGVSVQEVRGHDYARVIIPIKRSYITAMI